MKHLHQKNLHVLQRLRSSGFGVWGCGFRMKG